MAIPSLLKSCRFERINNAVAAGTGDTTSSASVDMNGYDSVCFIAAFGTLTATAATTMHAQESSDDGSSDAFANLLGTNVAIADTDDNKIAILDIKHTPERYLRVQIIRATANAVIDGIWAIQYNADEEPTTQGSDVAVSELHVAVDEGTK